MNSLYDVSSYAINRTLLRCFLIELISQLNPSVPSNLKMIIFALFFNSVTDSCQSSSVLYIVMCFLNIVRTSCGLPISYIGYKLFISDEIDFTLGIVFIESLRKERK